MKKFALIMFGVLPALCWAQQRQTSSPADQDTVNRVSIYGGMGIHGTDAPGIEDYLSSVNRTVSHALSFATTIEFFGGIELPLSRSWALKAEHAYLFKSYTLDPTTYGTDNLKYNVQAPMLMAQYVIPGRGYFFKFGAGGGYHWGTIDVHQSTNGQDILYKAHGVGMRAELEGQTAFDRHLFGYFSGTLGFEELGKAATDDGLYLTSASGAVSLNYFTAGIRFGLMYYF